jgi:DNA-binding transcriptional MerR regulator
MARRLTLKELARRTGEPTERLTHWQSLGLIGLGEDGELDQADVGRSKLIHDLLHHGVELETIAETASQPDSVFRRYLVEVSPMWSRARYSMGEAAEVVDADIELVRRLTEAAGIREPGEMLSREDVRFLNITKKVLDGGYPEEGLLQVLRVYADAMDRVAEAESR